MNKDALINALRARTKYKITNLRINMKQHIFDSIKEQFTEDQLNMPMLSIWDTISQKERKVFGGKDMTEVEEKRIEDIQQNENDNIKTMEDTDKKDKVIKCKNVNINEDKNIKGKNANKTMEDDNKKNKVIKTMEDDNKKNKVIKTMEDNNKKNKVIKTMEDNNKKNKVIKTMEDDNIKGKSTKYNEYNSQKDKDINDNDHKESKRRRLNHTPKNLSDKLKNSEKDLEGKFGIKKKKDNKIFNENSMDTEFKTESVENVFSDILENNSKKQADSNENLDSDFPLNSENLEIYQSDMTIEQQDLNSENKDLTTDLFEAEDSGINLFIPKTKGQKPPKDDNVNKIPVNKKEELTTKAKQIKQPNSQSANNKGKSKNQKESKKTLDENTPNFNLSDNSQRSKRQKPNKTMEVDSFFGIESSDMDFLSKRPPGLRRYTKDLDSSAIFVKPQSHKAKNSIEVLLPRGPTRNKKQVKKK